MHEYSNIKAQGIPQETKEHFRQVFKQTIEEIIDGKLNYNQNSWHYYKSKDNCKSCHCVLGHVELKILKEIGDRGSYCFSNGLDSEGFGYIDCNGNRSNYSTMVVNFAQLNPKNNFDSDIEVWGASFLGIPVKAKIISDEKVNLFMLTYANLTLYEMVQNWNKIVKKENWNDKLLLSPKYFAKAMIA